MSEEIKKIPTSYFRKLRKRSLESFLIFLATEDQEFFKKLQVFFESIKNFDDHFFAFFSKEKTQESVNEIEDSFNKAWNLLVKRWDQGSEEDKEIFLEPSSRLKN